MTSTSNSTRTALGIMYSLIAGNWICATGILGTSLQLGFIAY